MTEAKLEAKRSDAREKCANCEKWTGGYQDTGALCTLHMTLTLDLAVCTGWEEKK